MAVDTNYRVKADLVLDATKATGQAVAYQRKIQNLGRAISGTNSMAGGLTRNLVAMGATYLGLNALINGFRSLTVGATQYANELQQTKIGLTSVLAAVQGTEWDVAAKTAGTVFEQVRQDSIKSVATAQQLFTLYQGIVGPISAAGFGLKTVRDMTSSTVSAAGVLGVDLDQAQRDMSLMVRGAAGMDVKLFSMLRSTGAIVETTEEWNKQLTGAERVEKLQGALDKFAPAGDRFAKSFAGVTSTFKGIRQEFTRSAWQPVMDAAAASLGRINTKLIDNQEILQERLEKWGTQFAARLEKIFKGVEFGVDVIINRWDEVLQKAAQFQRIMGTVGKVAAVGAAVQVARPALGAAVGGVGMLTGSFAASQAAAATAATAGGAGGAAGGAAGAAGIMAALGPALAVAAAGAAVLGSVVLVVKEQWASFASMFDAVRPILIGLGEDVVRLGLAFWKGLRPILTVVGHVVAGAVVPGLALMLLTLRNVVAGLADMVEAGAAVVTFVYDKFKPAFDYMWKTIDHFVSLIMNMVNNVTGDTLRYNQRKMLGKDEDTIGMLEKRFAQGDYVPPWAASQFEGGAAKGRSTTVNDFRGSKIQVKQTFKDQDPDRVMLMMAQGIQRQAEKRLQSGMIPALAR